MRYNIRVLFYCVVADAAKAGELRTQVIATQKTAILRCSALRDVNDIKSGIKVEVQATTGEPTLFAAR